MQMEGDMNILNFAIDNERVKIVEHLASIAKENPEFGEKLVQHRFSKD